MVDRALLVPVVRRTPWRTTVATVVVAAPVVWWRRLAGDPPSELLWYLRVVSVVLAVGVATCLEDGSETLTVTTALGRRRRRTLSVLASVALALGGSFGIAAVTLALGDGGFPLARLALELVALSAVGVAIAAAVVALRGWRGSGTRAAVGLLLVVLLSLGHPRGIEWWWVAPGDEPAWTSARTHWLLVGVVATALVCWLSRDPAARLDPRRR